MAPGGDAFQIINCRNWQAINTDVDNYFIAPDFHYTVINETGAVDNTVVTVSDKGVITAKSAGTAIVLVTYDAMVAHHTTNVGNNGNAFFSAIWPENTGVFVVTVGAPATSGITPNMNIGGYWNNEGNDKVDGTALDSEHDVLYYEESTGGFDYTFKPEGAVAVSVANPAIGANSVSYSGFTPVAKNDDGTYTVKVTFGRNIVRLTSSAGASEYQVITAKPVTWTVSNLTHEGEKFVAGDQVSVKFNTLYHPANKLSGIYNMSAGIQYTGENVNFPLILGPGQYTFASRAQEYKMTIPADYSGDEYVLTNGVIKVNGFGSYYGEHRNITLQNGVDPNLNASVRLAYFGSLPDIVLPFAGIPPTVPGNLIATPVDGVSVFLQWAASKDNVAVTGYTIWVNGELNTTVPASTTFYVVEGLTPATTYTFEVAAFDAAGNVSAKATATATTATGVIVDNTPPTVPTNLAGVATETTIALTWTASTDNVAVAGYNVYVNGNLAETVVGTTYTLTGLTENETYFIQLEAFDLKGNISAKAQVFVKTAVTDDGTTGVEISVLLN